MNNYIKNLILTKLFQNVNFSGNPGFIIASPSNDPPYKFHWIRDSAIVMKSLIDVYLKNKNTQNLMYIINYIESEYKIQNLDTISGLGEPKIRIDGTPFLKPWGRPQNDGPALRGINMIKIYNILKKKYNSICKNIVIKIIEKDINYILKNYRNTSFDLWEEIDGWHFYTRLVQLKFIKEFIKQKEEFKKLFKINEHIDEIYINLKKDILDHSDEEKIISSFDKEGNIVKVDDSANLLAFCHVDFDTEFINLYNIKLIMKNAENLNNYFKKKYKKDNKNLIGRYMNDRYYNGHIWIICSLAIAQLYIHYSKHMNDSTYFKKAQDIFNFIVSIDKNLDLSEQYDIDHNSMLSAERLTWNFSELYRTLCMLKKLI